MIFDDYDLEFSKNKDDIKIYLKFKNQIVGTALIDFRIDGYSYFENFISENEYLQIFDKHKKIAKLNHILIYDNYKNLGLGLKMMKIICYLSKLYNVDLLYLKAMPMGDKGLSFENLLKFYEKFGFEIMFQNTKLAIMIKNII